MKRTFHRAAATLAFACCSAFANASVLTSITHDYGLVDGANALNTFNSCDTLNASSITVRDGGPAGCARFLDSFNFGTGLGTITSLKLTLNFSNTADVLESWAMRPATSGTAGSTRMQNLTRSTAAVPQSFTIDSLSNPAEFSTIISNGNFFLWFAENGFGTHNFILNSATLEVNGDAAVPEPGSLALFGIAALAIGAVSRKSRKALAA